jgi:hypothetical protein
LHCAWCNCSHLCCHPYWVSYVLKPECFPCLLMFEIQVPFICLQPEIQIELISHVFSASHTSKVSSEQKKPHWDSLHQQENFVRAYCHLLTFSSLLVLSHQCKGSEKNFCQRVDHSRTRNQERATRLTPTRPVAPLSWNSDRIYVKL